MSVSCNRLVVFSGSSGFLHQLKQRINGDSTNYCFHSFIGCNNSKYRTFPRSTIENDNIIMKQVDNNYGVISVFVWRRNDIQSVFIYSYLIVMWNTCLKITSVNNNNNCNIHDIFLLMFLWIIQRRKCVCKLIYYLEWVG